MVSCTERRVRNSNRRIQYAHAQYLLLVFLGRSQSTRDLMYLGLAGVTVRVYIQPTSTYQPIAGLDNREKNFQV